MRRLTRVGLDALLISAGLVSIIAVLPGVLAYKAYKGIRKRLDEEYRIITDAEDAIKELKNLIEDVMPLTMFPDYSPNLTHTRQYKKYKYSLEEAAEFYKRKGEQRIANEFIKELNRLTISQL